MKYIVLVTDTRHYEALIFYVEARTRGEAGTSIYREYSERGWKRDDIKRLDVLELTDKTVQYLGKTNNFTNALPAK